MNRRQQVVRVGRMRLVNDGPLVLMAGPCVIESEKLAMSVAERLATIAQKARVGFIFKSSYDKANRTSVGSFRGPGLKAGLKILSRIKRDIGVPVLTDVHTVGEVAPVAEVADVIQIPAFLCRQTDLLVAAGWTGRVVNIKKGQFLAPWDITHAIAKVVSTGNRNILLTERGVSFGYNNLIVDMRSLAVLRELGYPVVFDATHSVQLPGGRGAASGGQREFIFPLARAATAVGVAGLFMEVHPDPRKALSDGANSIRLRDLPRALSTLVKIDRTVK